MCGTSLSIGSFMLTSLILIMTEKSNVLQLLKQRQDAWTQVEYDTALEKAYPHVVGVALKSKNFVPPPPPKAPAPPKTAKEAVPKPPKTKGFS